VLANVHSVHSAHLFLVHRDWNNYLHVTQQQQLLYTWHAARSAAVLSSSSCQVMKVVGGAKGVCS